MFAEKNVHSSQFGCFSAFFIFPLYNLGREPSMFRTFFARLPEIERDGGIKNRPEGPDLFP